MLNLLGYWGSVTVFTAILVVFPASFLGWHVLSSLVKSTVQSTRKHSEIMERFWDKLPPFCKEDAGTLFIVGSSTLAAAGWFASVLAYKKHGIVETYSITEIVAYWSATLAPYLGGVFLLVLSFFLLRWVLRKTYVLHQKVEKALSNIERE